MQSIYKQDFMPHRKRPKVPGVSLTGGVDSKTNGGGLYRQVEVITMAVVAILIAVGVVALVFLGIFFALGAAFYLMCSVS